KFRQGSRALRQGSMWSQSGFNRRTKKGYFSSSTDVLTISFSHEAQMKNPAATVMPSFFGWSHTMHVFQVSPSGAAPPNDPPPGFSAPAAFPVPVPVPEAPPGVPFSRASATVPLFSATRSLARGVPPLSVPFLPYIWNQSYENIPR